MTADTGLVGSSRMIHSRSLTCGRSCYRVCASSALPIWCTLWSSLPNPQARMYDRSCSWGIWYSRL